MSKIYFAHRPPSVGVHLLSDPLPARTVSPAAMQTRDEDLTGTKRFGRQTKAKKSGLRT